MFFYSKDASGRSTGNETLYIPYVIVAVVVLVLAVVFYFAYIPDIKTEDDYHLDDATPSASHSIWTHPHFVDGGGGAVFLRGGPGGHLQFLHQLHDRIRGSRPFRRRGIRPDQACQRNIPAAMTELAAGGWFEPNKNGVLSISDKGAANLASLGFVCFLIGRFTGAGLLKKFSAHKVLGLYGVMNVIACLLIFLKLGWLSVACVFLSYFFMSIMFPTIFALGIFGLGARAKKGVRLHRHGHHGRRHPAQAHGLRRGQIRHVPRIYRAALLLRLRRLLWLRLAEVERRGRAERGQSRGRTLRGMARETLELRRQRTQRIMAALQAAYPQAHCELDHSNPLELLIATILSAQCTDRAGEHRHC